MSKKTFYIKTFGCKVNQYESQVIREGFLRAGYIESKDSDDADIFVVNTCTVTSVSDSKSLKYIRSALKKKGRCVIATGCMVDAGELDLRKLKGVEFIINNKDKYNIPNIVTGYRSQVAGRRLENISGFSGHARAFVKIQDGCDNRCSYCKVCIVRGRSRSRPFKEIIEECRALINNNYKEIVLTGICLGSYGRDIPGHKGLSDLISELCRIKGEWRIRLSSIEPKDVTDSLVSQIGSEEKLCKHLHIPFQSGDNEILKKMNRPYTRKDYIDIVKRLRNSVPDIAISTDIMVGFPGEGEDNFKNTVDFIKEIKPMRLHVFGFSKRPGTMAYTYKNDVASALKKERERILMDMTSCFYEEFKKSFAGKDVKVLVEDKRNENGFLEGYTDRYIRVLIDGPDTLKSNLITCKIDICSERYYALPKCES